MDPLDFNHREKPPQFVDVVNARIDTALTLENSTREPRAYLGGSRLGESCARKLQYEYLKVPRDPEREFNGKTLRIFAVGHVYEDLAVDWLTKGGYDLRTRNSSGDQFGFAVADGRVRGHIDGVIVAGPGEGTRVTITLPLDYRAAPAFSKGRVARIETITRGPCRPAAPDEKVKQIA